MSDRKLRILLIPLYFAPLGSPRGIRWTNIAHYLALKGCDITVIAADAPENSQFWDPSLQQIVASADDRLHVLRAPIGRRTASARERLTWAWKAFSIIRSLGNTYDAVISSAMPIFCHFLGRWVKQTGHAQYWIADYGDPWSTSRLRHKSAIRAQIEQTVERQLLTSADALTITTMQAIESFTPVYPHKEQIHLIPQGASMFHLVHNWDNDIRQPGEPVRLLFTGELTLSRVGPDLLFEALAKCGKRNAILILIGRQSADWKKRAKAFGSEDQVTVWAEYFPQEEIVKQQSAADMLVEFAYKVPQHVGGKFYEYLASNKPILRIVADPHDEPSQLIRQHGAGFVATTTTEIINAIEQVKAQIEQTGYAQRNRVSGVGFDERADRYLNLIDALRA